MSQITGEKVALRLKEPGRCRLLYEILLAGRAIGEVELDHIAWRSGGRAESPSSIQTAKAAVMEPMRSQPS